MEDLRFNERCIVDMRQVIIVRKDLQMSPGKLSVQVAHASNAFMLQWFKKNTDFDGHVDGYIDWDIFDGWICGIYKKTVCQAKNRNDLMKAVKIAQELGLKEGRDYFLIKDYCLTELEPEEIDEDGVGKVLTCIAFKPMVDEISCKISKKYQLYR